MRVLAGDIGGATARFMIAEVEAEGCNLSFSHTLPNEEHPYFESALTDFLEMAGDAAVGVGWMPVLRWPLRRWTS
jgi:glucokinase